MILNPFLQSRIIFKNHWRWLLLKLLRLAWLGIIETEYEKNDNKNHLRIF